MKIMYCIVCEQWVEVKMSKRELSEGYPPVHIKYIPPSIDSPAEFDWCEGPFVLSEPPIISEFEWDTILSNPPMQKS